MTDSRHEDARDDADDERPRRHDDAHLGPLRRGRPFGRLALREAVEDGGVRPERVAEAAVQVDLALGDERGKRLLRPLGRGRKEGEEREGEERGPERASEEPQDAFSYGDGTGRVSLQPRTASSWSTAQSISSRVMTSGGARRIVWAWVSLQSMPRSFSW